MVLNTSRLSVFILLSLAIVGMLVAKGYDAASATSSQRDRPEQVILTPNPHDDGVTLSDVGSGYLSPVQEAKNPFTHMLLRWAASTPVSSTLTIDVRSSMDGQTWSDWLPLEEDPDLWKPEDGLEVHWSQIIYAGDGARFWQVRTAIQPAPDGAMPELRQIDMNTTDGRYANTQSPHTSPDNGQVAAVSKPPVISRTSWGCPDGQRSRVSPDYYPVNHLIIHHTADANSLVGSENDWGDRVRSIWSFHTYTRGWGDVGYNYLIDPNGTIYEGRSGGDDAVGFHDTGNYGSMGVSLIGTYQSVSPGSPMINSLVTLLAWKANQKGIDPLGRSYYYGCDISAYCTASGAVLYNISGHRHVSPSTSCPGDATVGLLPSIRNRVKLAMEGGTPEPVPDNGDTVIDELESSFARSDAQWYDSSCGYNEHTYYTYATDSQEESTNSATWRPKIPERGRYRVFASIPQGCGLASSPYASTRAAYRVISTEGVSVRTVDQNTADEWVDLGTYTFDAGTNGAVELFDLTGEPYSEERVLFFDTIKWERAPEDQPDVELVNVAYEPTTIAAGELLKVTFTLRNRGGVAVQGQAPEAGTLPSGGFDSNNGYAYDENECFLAPQGRDYPTFGKETGRFRITLGATNRDVPCDGEAGGYPWRWGINGTMQPGETRDVIGYIRFREPGEVTLQAGLVQEYVRYQSQGVAQTTVKVVPERVSPVLASYDEQLQPLALVYRLGAVPENLLARTQNPLSIVRGEYVGSFVWNGQAINWGDGGPLGLQDSFLIEQTRVFQAPVTGKYTFRTTTDDGSWLWIDGQAVVTNYGLHGPRDGTGEVTLNAGTHVLSFKYFERSGWALASYDVKLPGSSTFTPISEGFVTGSHLGSTFLSNPTVILGADDQGGTGTSRVRYSWDGNTWSDAQGALAKLGRMVKGTYSLRYQAVDNGGNTSATSILRFTVNPDLPVERLYLPSVRKQQTNSSASYPAPES